MGRGLSPLQQTALRLALDNHEREGRELGQREGCDVFFEQILGTVYRDPNYRAAGTPGGHPSRWYRQEGRCAGEGGKGFSNAERAAVSRAVARLEERGLVVYHRGVCWGPRDGTWSGVRLTEAGLAAARTLFMRAEPGLTDRQDSLSERQDMPEEAAIG